jgi:hypothetical protein
MGTRFLLLLFAFVLPGFEFSTANAYAQGVDRVHLQVCNKGSVPVEFVLASQTFDANDLRRGATHYHWAIEGTYFRPGVCWEDAYSGRGAVQQIYLGFGLKNARGEWVPLKVPNVPDFGTYVYNVIQAGIFQDTERPVMKRAQGHSVCVHMDETMYGLPDERLPAFSDCRGFQTQGSGPHTGTGPFVPLSLTLDFFPVPEVCGGTGRYYGCAGGEYFLNFAADPATGNVRVVEAEKDGSDAPDRAQLEAEGQKMLDDVRKQREDFANAKASVTPEMIQAARDRRAQQKGEPPAAAPAGSAPPASRAASASAGAPVPAPPAGAPARSNLAAAPVTIPLSTTLVVTTTEPIDFFGGDVSRPYKAKLEVPIALSTGATLPAGAEVLLKLSRVKGPNFTNVTLTAQSVNVAGRPVPVATMPFAETIPENQRAPGAVAAGLRLGLMVIPAQ